MKMIVTGGEGFIGKALVAAFIERGHQVHRSEAEPGDVRLSESRGSVMLKSAIFEWLQK